YQQPCEGPIGGAFAQYCAPRGCGPRWSFAAEAIALQRSTTRSQSLFRNTGDTADLLNSKDFNFPVAFGPKVSAIRHGAFGSDFDVEVGYFQFDGFEANAFVSENSLMVIDVNNAFLSTDSSARYASALYCGEVNVRWQWFDWLTLSSGFRMVELDEQYNARGTGTRNLRSLSLDVNSFNHLYGYQLGADGEVFNLGGALRINALCKAGVFGNFASQNIHAVETGLSDDSLSAVNNRVSFLGEIGLVATYAITQRLAFRASYQAMWLEGVGLAPEQIDTSNFTAGTAKVNLDGGVFYHGGGLGLEYRF
ncbi:MAG: hypothetical protein K8R46_09350, partial [Pirellulales bacterium]|nr:hypothetical protein [Pirellulales bacterium]